MQQKTITHHTFQILILKSAPPHTHTLAIIALFFCNKVRLTFLINTQVLFSALL